MAGLDPAICARSIGSRCTSGARSVREDGRVKPSHDGLFLVSEAKQSRSAGGTAAIRPESLRCTLDDAQNSRRPFIQPDVGTLHVEQQALYTDNEYSKRVMPTRVRSFFVNSAG